MDTDTIKQIHLMRWDVETSHELVKGTIDYRASQGGFKTLWRGSPEEVLADVRKIQEARKQPSSAPF